MPVRYGPNPNAKAIASEIDALMAENTAATVSAYQVLPNPDLLKVSAQAIPQNGSAEPRPYTPPARLLANAGHISFAVLDTSIKSTEPGPVLATIATGRFAGARLLGGGSRGCMTGCCQIQRHELAASHHPHHGHGDHPGNCAHGAGDLRQSPYPVSLRLAHRRLPPAGRDRRLSFQEWPGGPGRQKHCRAGRWNPLARGRPGFRDPPEIRMWCRRGRRWTVSGCWPSIPTRC